MRSNYKRLGDYIRKVDNRNKELQVTKLMGLSMTKEFRATTSNVVGTDLSVYKIVSKWQFACDFMSPIRVNKLPVVLKYDSEPIIVSPAYPVFEIIDHNILDPEYLMMWFRRDEFDRYVTFKCDSAIRGGYDWEELCDTTILLPEIKKQREIVAEYNVVQKRIDLNNQLIQKLEETAQAIYKQWFVDFEFPNEEGKPYKSSGGEMIDSELGELPKGWRVGVIGDLVYSTLGGDWGKDESVDNYVSKVLCIRGTDISKASKGFKKNLPIRYILNKNKTNRRLIENDIVIELSGGSPTQSTGRSLFISKLLLDYLKEDVICSNFCRVLKSKDNYSIYLYCIK